MGLDITYYKNLTQIDCVFNADGDPIDPATRQPIEYCTQANVHQDFPERAGQVEDRAVYSCESQGGFRAGSYGGYNQWREELAKLAGYPAVETIEYGKPCQRHDAGAFVAGSGPFWELIYFSDCEGIIGASVSAKLAADFAAHQDKADAHESERFRVKYSEWRKAFEEASHNGAVDFH